MSGFAPLLRRKPRFRMMNTIASASHHHQSTQYHESTERITSARRNDRTRNFATVLSYTSSFLQSASSTRNMRTPNSIVQKQPPYQHQSTSVRSMMARSSAPCDETPADKCLTFLISIGYDSLLAQDIVKALQDAGLSGEALLATARQMAGRWEVGEDAGLEALAATIKAERARSSGKSMVKIYVVPPSAWDSGEVEEHVTDFYEEYDDNDDHREGEADVVHKDDDVSFSDIGEADMSRAFSVTAVEGTTLTDVAKFGIGDGASTLGEYMECACSGIMACSTCHVVVEPGEWFENVGPPSEAEQDMLDLAYGPRATSRLGCQIVLTEDMNGLIIRLPAGANNLMDDIPFKD